MNPNSGSASFTASAGDRRALLVSLGSGGLAVCIVAELGPPARRWGEVDDPDDALLGEQCARRPMRLNLATQPVDGSVMNTQPVDGPRNNTEPGDALGDLDIAVSALDGVEFEAIDDPGELARLAGLILTTRDRLAALVPPLAALLEASGVKRVDAGDTVYRVVRSTTYRWDIPVLLKVLQERAAELGRSEVDVVVEGCSVVAGKVTGLRALSIDPDDFREPRVGEPRMSKSK